MNEFLIPQGTRDYVNGECRTRKQYQTALEKIFETWGYEEVITPMIEYYNTFSIADMKEEEMYKILDASGRILTLRPDMTIPIARVAATKFKDSKGPLRFMHCSNVFKVNAELHGNSNERNDCGVELIGVEEAYGDLEILACACEALSILKDVRYTLEIGNLNFFRSACKDLNLTSTQVATLADLVNRKSLRSLQEYCDSLAISDEMKAFFNALPWLCGDASIIKEARAYAFNEELQEILNKLETLCSQLKALGYEETITIDLGKVPQLKYYTGLLFEAFVEGVGISILSGGRYDELLKRFGKDTPAVGFAVRLDSLLSIQSSPEKPLAYTIKYPKSMQVQALQKASELRNKEDAIVTLLPDDTSSDMEVRKDVEVC